MMNWGNYGSNMMGGWGTVSIFAFLFWLVIFVDLVLLGIWLWQQIQKGKK